METITVEGIVPESFKNQREFYLKVSDKDRKKASSFFAKTNTVFRSNSIAIRKREFLAKCRAGDRVAYTLELFPRKDGLRVVGVDLKLI